MKANGPAPWVGLGWNLGSSSISCDHKGTATHTDDDFYLISEIGVPSRLIKPNRVRYKYYEGSITTLNSLTPEMLKETGKCSYFNIRRTEKAENFAFVFESKMKLEYNGNHTFYLNSDDGSRLYINNELIVDNDGTHSPQERSGTKALNSGFHNLRVEFFQAAGGRELWVGYSHETAFSKKQIPIDVLFDTDDKFNGKQFFVENNPHIKCEPQDLNGDGVYEGWVVTNIDGSKLMFGNLSFGEDHKATRNVFRQGNFAGLVTNGTPVLFPYAWDLVASMDVAGNSTQYWYQQEEEAIHSGTFMSDSLSTPQKYTKASYPYIIRSSSGIRFAAVLVWVERLSESGAVFTLECNLQ